MGDEDAVPAKGSRVHSSSSDGESEEIMNIRKSLYGAAVCAALIMAVGSTGLWAQNAEVRSRVVEPVDDTHTVTLKGNVHPLARPEYDQGALPESQPMTHMMLVLQRSQTQELALRQLLDAQVTKGSGSYHNWLTPEQFGKQYGPSDADVQAVTDWLSREGFQVRQVVKGKTVVEFDGTVAQVQNAFHTQIHKFVVNGEEHFANVSDPAIPEALSPVVAGVAALHNFPKHAYVKSKGLYRRYKDTGKIEPLFTYGSPVHYAMGPGDFAKIYNIPSTATGSGQSIAVIAQTNINLQDVTDFRHMFGLDVSNPPNNVTVVVNGPDPGIVGPTVVSCTGSTDDEVESDLDTEWAGAIAPQATIYLVVSESTCSNPTQVSQGVDLSALYAVDNNLAPVLSESYGTCEPELGTTGNQFYNALWEQASAQGITVAVAAGDSGSAGCDPSTDPDAATQGAAVSGTASTPFNVAVGGTDFDPTTTTTNVSTYWAPNTTGDVINSALGYMPETTWDDSACAQQYATNGTNCTSVDTTIGADISAGSGGPSNCSTLNGSQTACVSGYAKPSFQTALTPADSVRDLPDISFFASNGGPLVGGTGVAYVICQSDTNPQNSATPTGASCNLTTPYEDFSLVGGTSAATPAFAAVMALVNQSTGQRQGNANYVLYNLAAMDTNYTGGMCASSVGQTPASGCVFNDVTKGNNAVACDAGTPNCSNTANVSGEYGVIICTPSSTANGGATCPTVDKGNPAFVSGTGYDLATGLGSINVTNLLTKWTTAYRTGTTTTLASPSGGSPSGTAFTANVSVTPTSATGDVSLIALASDQITVLGSYGPFTLSGGSATVSTNLLPPNTAYVEATYGGSVTYGVSTSNPVALSGAVAGANQTSTLKVYYVGFTTTSNGTVVPNTPTTSSQNFVYGSGDGYILKIVVTGSTSPFNQSCSYSQPSTKPSFPCPTGTVKEFDGGQPLNDFLSNGTATNQASLNNQGFAEDQPINLNAGSHSITATYSGDGNYAATNTSNTLSITVTQASTATLVGTSVSSITSGQSVTLTAYVTTSSFANGPTGTVQFTSNGSSLGSAAKCTPVNGSANTSPPIQQIAAGTAYCTATLTTTISSLYPPPTGGPGTPTIPRIPVIVALLSLLLFALGMRWIPQTRRRAYTYAGLLAIALLVGVVAGCGGGSSSGGGGGSGTRTIGAAYSGDTNYTASSGTAQIIVQAQ